MIAASGPAFWTPAYASITSSNSERPRVAAERPECEAAESDTCGGQRQGPGHGRIGDGEAGQRRRDGGECQQQRNTDPRDQKTPNGAGGGEQQRTSPGLALAQDRSRKHGHADQPRADRGHADSLATASRLVDPAPEHCEPPPPAPLPEHQLQFAHQHRTRRGRLERAQQRVEQAQTQARVRSASCSCFAQTRSGPVERWCQHNRSQHRQCDPEQAAHYVYRPQVPMRPRKYHRPAFDGVRADADAGSLYARRHVRELRFQIAYRERQSVGITEPCVARPTHLVRIDQRRRGNEQEEPDEEKQHISAGAAQPGQEVEQHREERGQRQRWKRQHEHRLGKFDEIECAILCAYPLRDPSNHEPEQHDHGEDDQVARPLRKQVAAARHRCGDEQLPDPRVEIANERATHEIETEQRQHRRIEQPEHHAHPGARIDAAHVVAERHGDVAGVHRWEAPPGADSDNRQDDPEARGAGPLAQVGDEDREKPTQGAHHCRSLSIGIRTAPAISVCAFSGEQPEIGVFEIRRARLRIIRWRSRTDDAQTHAIRATQRTADGEVRARLGDVRFGD